MEASSTGSEDTANYWSGFGSGTSQKGPFWGHFRPHFRGFLNSGPNVDLNRSGCAGPVRVRVRAARGKV